MNTVYNDIIKASPFMRTWNGVKGFRYRGHRIDTSNSKIATNEVNAPINTNLVKQLYRFDNSTFNKLVIKGFHIKHRLATILFYNEGGKYYIASENVKTFEVTIYEVNTSTKLEESDKAIQVPLLNLIAMLDSIPVIK